MAKVSAMLPSSPYIVRPEQPEKASEAIDFTDAGIYIFSNDVQVLKTFGAIVFKSFGNITVFTFATPSHILGESFISPSNISVSSFVVP